MLDLIYVKKIIKLHLDLIAGSKGLNPLLLHQVLCLLLLLIDFTNNEF